MPGAPVSSQGLRLQHTVFIFWHSGLHIWDNSASNRTFLIWIHSRRHHKQRQTRWRQNLGDWFNAWTHKITSKKMRDPSVLVIPLLTQAKGMEGILKSNPKTRKKKKKKGMRPFHELKKDKKAQRKTWRKRKQSCQREADWIEKRRKKEVISAWNASRRAGCHCCRLRFKIQT